MKTTKIRRTNEEVIKCGELIAEGFTICQVERELKIPHSTVHWIVINRLPRLDSGLSVACKNIFYTHKYGKRVTV